MIHTNSTAVITGGSRGLGRNAAIQLARQGTDIIFTYRSNAAEAAAVVAEIEGWGRHALALQFELGAKADFASFATAVKNGLATWQRAHFDFLLNNAGEGVHAPLIETTEAEFDQLVNVHLKGMFFTTVHLLPLLADGGRILNVSSGLTRFALPGYSVYAAMKGAVEVITKYMAKELGARRITVNALAPGAIETDFGGGAVRDNVELNSYVAAQTALGRAGVPDDIGGVVAALLSPHSGWINGQRVEASGGMFL